MTRQFVMVSQSARAVMATVIWCVAPIAVTVVTTMSVGLLGFVVSATASIVFMVAVVVAHDRKSV